MKALHILLMLAAIGIAPQAMAASAVSVDIENDATPAEVAAVKRAWTDDEISVLPVTVGHADLNGDHRPDLILRTRNTVLCGAAIGCATGAVLATPNGYAHQWIVLGSGGGGVFMLPTMHNGMHDVRFEDGPHVFRWNGKKYQ